MDRHILRNLFQERSFTAHQCQGRGEMLAIEGAQQNRGYTISSTLTQGWTDE
jgi:hypothetical protein